MRLLRTLSTVKLLLLAGAVAVLAAAGAAIAVAAGGSGPTPPAEPLAQAIHDGLAAPEPQGITARIRFTNRLFPSGALVGQAGSALMSGASGRLWATNDGRGRLELQSDAGDVQIVWNQAKATVYDASSNTVYSIALPQHSGATKDTHAPPTVAEISDFLTRAAGHAAISGAQPDDVAGQPAYTVSVSPKHDGGLLGSVQLAWDAAQGVPLRVAVYAQGSASPVLELTATNISYGPVPDGDVNVAPPAGAKAVDLGAPAAKHEPGGHAAAVTGLPAVRAAAGFPVAAPDTLVGLPRRDVRLVGTDHPFVVAVYGHSLGAIVVVERKAGPRSAPGAMSALPAVSLDGLTAHELATQLGTGLEWRSGGVDTVLAGSLPPAAAEAAARALR
jgi:outer membrane lipoprotein-sorting protein